MANFRLKFEPTETPHLEKVTFRTDNGFLVGFAGPSALIAGMFGHEYNPARWKLLQSLEAPTAWLDRIKINKESRGQGSGTELMTKSLQVLLESGIRYVILSPQAEHTDDMERLDRFYKKLGFIEVRQFESENLWNRLMLLDLASVRRSTD
jgi:GNAT superfamily N-acetyltransferase